MGNGYCASRARWVPSPTMNNISFPNQITVTGQVIECANFSDATKVFVIDFTKRLIGEFRKQNEQRMVFGIAGPSGSGKSTLSVLVKEVAKEISSDIDIVPISIDAFHFSNEYLEKTFVDNVSLKQVKGRYDTYDVSALHADLAAFVGGRNVIFPEYSRMLHESQQNKIFINERPTILLIEGLWLLYGQSGWGSVAPLIDFVFYLDENEENSRKRTIVRHMSGGRTEEGAQKHYEESDALNRDVVLQTREQSDEIIVWPN